MLAFDHDVMKSNVGVNSAGKGINVTGSMAKLACYASRHLTKPACELVNRPNYGETCRTLRVHVRSRTWLERCAHGKTCL